jgi:hypothetical protein
MLRASGLSKGRFRVNSGPTGPTNGVSRRVCEVPDFIHLQDVGVDGHVEPVKARPESP